MLKGKHIYLRFLQQEDAAENLELHLHNKHFFETYSITREPNFYSLAYHLERIEVHLERRKNDSAYFFGIFSNESDRLIGNVQLFQVIRGPLQSAFIGYFLDKEVNGKGYMTEAVKLMVDYAFNELKLHRIEAGVMPHNLGSMRVLEKAGFHKEGLAVKNVLINNKWEDHQVLAIINPND
ncbi:GNAT family N-acetyltransferase [Paenibacillus sp. KN14-4R]|uniref:GNAT family N-acetyltransferase n=1 Tax=Paenibacillus sp. KN14-4R TaxID=3445773 RepID=UPI003F9FF8FE